MDLKIKELEIDGEKVFIKKSKIFGWGIINPIKTDGKLNLKNIIAGGSWIKLFSTLFLILIIYLATKEYVTIVNIANECLNKELPFIFTP